MPPHTIAPPPAAMAKPWLHWPDLSAPWAASSQVWPSLKVDETWSEARALRHAQ
jgi:hypothetical protein